MRCHCGETINEDDVLVVLVLHLHHRLHGIEQQLDLILQGERLLSDQNSDLAALADQIDSDVVALAGEIKTEIDAAVAAVEASHPGVDLSPVRAAVGRLDDLVAANVPTPAPPAEPAPAPTAEVPPTDAQPAEPAPVEAPPAPVDEAPPADAQPGT